MRLLLKCSKLHVILCHYIFSKLDSTVVMFQVRNLKTKKCDYSWFGICVVKCRAVRFTHNKVIVVTSHGDLINVIWIWCHNTRNLLLSSHSLDRPQAPPSLASHVYRWYNNLSGASFDHLHNYISKQLKTAQWQGLEIDCISIKLQICACTLVQWIYTSLDKMLRAGLDVRWSYPLCRIPDVM